MISEGAPISEKIKNLENLVEQLSLEFTLLRTEFELVKNEGCWLSKNNAAHLHGDITNE
jgi:hypothetical protein